MTNTANVGLGLIAANQNQKEVTINLSLYQMDALLRFGAKDKDLTAPPVSPADGDVYIVGGSATGDWATHDDEIAYYYGGWKFITPISGFRLWLDDEEVIYIYLSGAWSPFNGTVSSNGSYTQEKLKSVTLSAMSGANVTESNFIPDRALVKALTINVSTLITGATSFTAGYTGSLSAFGTIGVSLGTTNIGLLGNPQGFFADTDLILTAVGGNFTAGEVEAVLHYEEFKGTW